MSDRIERVVFDCNIFAQALLTPSGNAGKCVERVLDGSVSLFWSDFVLEEIRRIPEKETPKRLGITAEMVEALIVRLHPSHIESRMFHRSTSTRLTRRIRITSIWQSQAMQSSSSVATSTS